MAAGCASGGAEATGDAEKVASTRTSVGDGSIPPEEKSALEKKFCRATLDYLADHAEQAPPQTCKRVIMRRTEQFGGGEDKGYLVTVILGEDRQKIDLGAVVGADGAVELRSLQSGLESANVQQAELQIRDLQNKVDTYYLRSNPKKLPDTLADLVTAGLIEQVPADPWGNAYFYKKSSPTDYQIFSAGPDGQVGTLDDVRTR